MSEVERNFIKQVDEAILKASGDELKSFQKIDLKTQLDGESFYDILVNNTQKKTIVQHKPQSTIRKHK